ncbi:MAG: CDP-alcohol phosphatidyltransferase family protein [Anaerolineae bacterium]|nr:CDP-alcohol phosphatidyltransferase family protein [Anaerolineae bacterium]
MITVPIARFLARLGIHPNSVTVLGSLLSIGIGAILLNGNLALGGWLLAIVAPLDAVDGALARFVGQKSDFGAFLDSTLDRVSEAALLIGLAGHFLQQGATTAVILAIVTLFSSVMVSYTRARAESTGFSCKVGVFSRLERTVVLAAGLILGYATVALWVLAIGATFTALHRILHVYHQSRQQSAGE